VKLDELGLRFTIGVGCHVGIGGSQWIDLSRCVGHWGSFIRSPRNMKYVAHPLILLGLFVGERSAGTIFECLDQHPLTRGTD